MHRLLPPLLTLLTLAGCAGNKDDGGEQGPCGDGCPRGRVCVSGECQRPGPADAEAPDAGTIMVPDMAPRPDAELSDATLDADLADVELPDAEPMADMEIADAGAPDAEPPCTPMQIRDCGRTIGRCRSGRQFCDAEGEWGPCEGGVEPEPESCNGADDDCNGVVDDGFDVGEPCDGRGACGAGVLECRGAFLTVCSTEPGGSADEAAMETCNEADDDCDGLTDEGFTTGSPCIGQCGNGVQVCSPGGGVQCSADPGGVDYRAEPEVCDRDDNDCDGRADEGFDLGGACNGVGACGFGLLECDDEGGTRCNTDAGGTRDESADEACNAVDDDCDGLLDEGFGTGEPCEGEGACGEGVTECSPAGELRCSTDPGGTASEVGNELCNEADDDCDGRVDEGLALGLPCVSPGICGSGLRECGPEGRTICDVGPDGSASRAVAETCDGADEDCDGRTDEGFALGVDCAGLGACGAGVTECDDAGGARCSTGPGGSADQSGEEICDGVDNDCDGQLDEGGACGGETCLNAPDMAFGAAVTGNTAQLANDYDRSVCLGDSAGSDQIFRFDTEAAGSYVVGVAPLTPTYDVLFWVSESCDDLTRCIAGQDTGLEGHPEARVVSIPRGDTWFISVDSRANPGGAFAVGVTPLDDGERCGNAIPLSVPGRFVGTTERPRTDDVSGTQCPAGRITTGVDQIFRVSVPRAGLLRATVTPGQPLDPRRSIKPIVYVITDCANVDGTCVGGAGAQPAGSPEQLEVQVQPGDYFVVVDHEGDLGGAFLLEVDLQ